MVQKRILQNYAFYINLSTVFDAKNFHSYLLSMKANPFVDPDW